MTTKITSQANTAQVVTLSETQTETVPKPLTLMDDDSFYGDGGVVTTFEDENFYWCGGMSVLQQSDGKLVMEGYASSSFGIARYNIDGSLDSSFSGNGKQVTDLGWAGGFYGGAVLQQADGKLVVAGNGYNSPGMSVVRYNTDGSLDTSFSDDGQLTTENTGICFGLVQQADGKLIAAGGGDAGFFVSRYNTDGSLDSSFDGDGIRTSNLSSFHNGSYGNRVALQSDGKIVMAGWGSNSDSAFNDNLALTRYNTDGSIDFSFNGGKVIADVGGDVLTLLNEGASPVVIQKDGKIVVAGSVLHGKDHDFVLTRYNANGLIDTSFGDNGIVRTDFGADESVQSMILQADGKLVVTGYNSITDYSNRHGVMARYNSDGSLDTSFDDNGKVITVVDQPQAVIQQSDGKLVVAGSTAGGGSFVMARYNSDGSLDTMINNAPTGSVVISDNTPTQWQQLSVSNTLADVDGLGVINYAWLVDGVQVATGDHYTVTHADIGKPISVTASYTDSSGTNESVSGDATAAVVSLPVGVTITSQGNHTTGEDGSEARYLVVLNTQPVHDVSITFTSSDVSEGDIAQPTLLFTPATWSVPQTLVVRGVNDYLNDHNVVYNVAAAIKTLDVDYTAVSINPLALTNLDDGNDIPLKLYGDANGVPTNDVMQGKDGDDHLYGKDGADDLFGGIGNDWLYGGYYNDVLWGQDGNDKLFGEQDNDYLNGGVGDDTLDGGLGVDTLIGGAGNDTYFLGYDATDVIQDFGLASDVDQVMMPYQLKSYTLAAGIENASMDVTAKTNGQLFGNDSANKLTGNQGNNLINGKLGSDSLFAGAGNDTLNGGVGIDHLFGGVGNDTYFVNNKHDIVSETAVRAIVPNTDTVNSSVDYALPISVENLKLSGTAPINATGNELNNLLTGNAGNNILRGLDGNDTLNGMVGKDSLIGGAGKDIFVLATPAISSNINQLSDFNAKDDMIQLENAVFTSLNNTGVLASDAFTVGVVATTISSRIVYNKNSGALYYDDDGSGAHNALQIATLGVNLAVTNADFVII